MSSEHLTETPGVMGVGSLGLAERLTLPIFAATIFLGAFLLFSVQPMIAKMVLPLLGGSPSVWNTAMVFFQAALLAGYAYAHFSVRWLGLRRQSLLHLGVLALAFLAWPVELPEGWIPPAERFPVFWVLALLSVSVGLPFFAVSATAPVLQKWFARSGHSDASDPYFLYSTSNIGSVLALLSYPFLVEPLLRLQQQSWSWSWGYVGLFALMGLCALVIWKRLAKPLAAPAAPAAPRTATPAPSWRRRGRWVALAFVPSSLLLGVTAHITTDVAATPLFWVLPLVLYLLTYVIVFARRPLLRHDQVARALPFILALLPILFFSSLNIMVAVGAHLAIFFAVALFCHGALVAGRPAEDHLTEFYLWMSTGGVLGGIFNALLAPVIFPAIFEYALVLALACLFLPAGTEGRRPVLGDLLIPLGLAGLASAPTLLGIATVTGQGSLDVFLILMVLSLGIFFSRHRPRRMTAVILGVLLVPTAIGQFSGSLAMARSFFGVYRVLEVGEAGRFRVLLHGTTVHGAQDQRPGHRRTPGTYYSPEGPVGQIFEALNGPAAGAQPVERVGLLGLGVGTLACYRQPGQAWTYYEIDPVVARLARDTRYFSFLADCGAETEIVLGDGRIQLAAAADAGYDLLVLDAFSSDAVPLHLLTAEALALYRQKTARDGLILYHVSNRHLDLAQMVARLAESQGLTAWQRSLVIPKEEKDLYAASSSEWVIMTADPGRAALLDGLPGWQRLPADLATDLWTDDFSNIVGVIRW
jgi:hypothetical protein